MVVLLAGGCNSTTSVETNSQQSSQSTTSQSNKTYVASDFDFQIDYPAGWSVSSSSQLDGIKKGYQFDNGVSEKQDFYAFIITRENQPLSNLLSPSIKTVEMTLSNGMKAIQYNNTTDNRVTEQNYFILRGNYVYILNFQVHHSNINSGSGNPPALTKQDIQVRDSFIGSFIITK